MTVRAFNGSGIDVVQPFSRDSQNGITINGGHYDRIALDTTSAGMGKGFIRLDSNASMVDLKSDAGPIDIRTARPEGIITATTTSGKITFESRGENGFSVDAQSSRGKVTRELPLVLTLNERT